MIEVGFTCRLERDTTGRKFDSMRYQFLIETYATERLKVLSVWSMFHDGDRAGAVGAGM